MYQPLPDFVTIKESSVHGHGLFATERIPKGKWIGVIHIRSPHWIPSDLPHNIKGGFIRTPLGGFGNHSEDPNCIKFQSYNMWWIRSKRDIEEGEELTWKYTLYNVDA